MDLAFACVGGQTSLGFVCIRPDMTWRSIHLVFVWGIEVDLVFVWMVEIDPIFVFGRK